MKIFDKVDPKNKKALDEIEDWMGKHNLTMHEVMDLFSGFMAFAAIESGDPAFFMKELTGLLLKHLTDHEAV